MPSRAKFLTGDDDELPPGYEPDPRADPTRPTTPDASTPTTTAPPSPALKEERKQ